MYYTPLAPSMKTRWQRYIDGVMDNIVLSPDTKRTATVDSLAKLIAGTIFQARCEETGKSLDELQPYVIRKGISDMLEEFPHIYEKAAQLLG
jgi:hypothetical protein